MVRPPLFRDGTSGTTSNKEQVLASVALAVAIHRWVSTPVSLWFPLNLQTAYFSPTFSKQVRNP